MPAIVPVEITPALAPVSISALRPASSPGRSLRGPEIIEIELGDCRVRVDRDVDPAALQRVLELLKRR